MKIFIIMLILTSAIVAQNVYEITWDGSSATSSSIGLSYREIPVAIFSTMPVKTNSITFEFAESSDSLFMPIHDDSNALITQSFADSTYIGMYAQSWLGVSGVFRVISDSVETAGTTIKIITAPLR